MNAAHPEQAETGMSIEEMKAFVRRHFDQFVNRQDLDIADVNFARDFVDHGSDVPPGTPPGPIGAKQYVGGALKKFPDLHVTIEDLIAEGDKVVVRNVWRATDPDTGRKMRFAGIVIWRIARRQLAERWAYLESPRVG